MKIKKSQKPTDIEASLKYICPQCFLSHWIFLREARIKNYKIVCDCGTILKPKRISELDIVYAKKESKSSPSIPDHILNKCSRILVDHGFSRAESLEFINKAYDTTKSTDISDLIKTSIKLFGESKNVKL